MKKHSALSIQHSALRLGVSAVIFAATVLGAEVTALWNANPAADNVVGYTVYVTNAPLPLTAATSNRFTVPDAGDYFIEVSASNEKRPGELQEGPRSEPLHFRMLDGVVVGEQPPPGAPTGLKLAAVGMAPDILFPPASGFVPTDIAGLQLWLDASDASTLYDATSGGSLVAADGAVARWEDKSGNARHATQATSTNRPDYKPSSIGGALRFNGTNDVMECNALSSFFHGDDPPWTVCITATVTDTASVKAAFGMGASGSTDYFYWLGANSTEQIRTDRREVFPAAHTVEGGGAFTQNVLSYVMNGTNVSLYVGSTLATNANYQLLTTGTNINRVAIGALIRSTTSTWWPGDIGEVLMWNSALTSNQIAQVSAYLKAKRGIP